MADTAPKESVGTDTVGVPEPKRTRKEVSVNISVCKRQRVSQELNVKENDQKVFGTFRAASGPEPTQEAPINLGDFLPGNVVLRPQDITISRSLTVDGGEVSMTVTYDSV